MVKEIGNEVGTKQMIGDVQNQRRGGRCKRASENHRKVNFESHLRNYSMDYLDSERH